MNFKQSMELEEERHRNRTFELKQQENNIRLEASAKKELIRIETAEKRKLENLKFELMMKARKR